MNIPFLNKSKHLYTYYEIILLLDEHPNIKEYIKYVFIIIIFLLTPSVSEVILKAVKKISRLKRNTNSQIYNFKFQNHFDKSQKITRIIKEVTNSLEEKQWSTNIKTFLDGMKTS